MTDLRIGVVDEATRREAEETMAEMMRIAQATGARIVAEEWDDEEKSKYYLHLRLVYDDGEGAE
jgi:hypothetical protein